MNTAPVRYYAKWVKIPIRESIALFFKKWEWKRKKCVFVAIHKGEEGYENAPWESRILELR